MIWLVSDRRRALEEQFRPWHARTLHQALDEAARRFPARPFVITDQRSWTYAEMVDWSLRVAAGLRRNGIKADDKIAIILGNYPEFVALKFAISRVGGVAVPINVFNRRDEIRYLLAQSDSALLVTMDCYRGNDYLAVLDEILPGWEKLGDGPSGETLPMLRQVMVLATGETPPREKVTPFAALDREPGADDEELGAGDPAAVCDIIYTSGTTGAPKGVMLTHDMLTRTAFGGAYARAFEDGHRIIFSLPMFHVFGYVEGLLSVLWVGGAIIPQLRFDAEDTLAAIERHRASDALLIPAMTLALLDLAEGRRHDLSSLHFALASGGRAPERIWQAIHDVLGVREITTGYGMTETTATTTLTLPQDPIERLVASNGCPRDVGPAGDPSLGGKLVLYQVVDTETGALLAAGEIGELVAKGPGVTSGYYKKPEATADAFDAHGWLKTGDLGRIDADGYVSLVGRSKESYRCGGEQVLPTEIEDVLTTNVDVLQAHVVPVPDERMGEVGVAFIVPRPGAEIDPEALRSDLVKRLARFKVPRHILVVAEGDIPLTASGRARKFLLSKQAVEMLDLS